VRRIEVMAPGKDLEREVREDLSEPVGHPRVVVRVAPTAQSEVDRSLEPTQHAEFEIRSEEGPKERPQAGSGDERSIVQRSPATRD
jgi:hypothetical protein